MPYGNYSFVIDSSFKPFTMQEMMVPLAMYKDEYEKSEAAYDELVQKADVFKNLADEFEKNSDSRAAKIYKNYADELHKQAEDLANNGLSISNRRALTNLKRRYHGEIGLLDRANTRLTQELDLRRQLGAKDPSMLYALPNLNIDMFLDDEMPNLYSISGNELYTRGATAAKAASARIYNVGDGGATLGGLYRDFVERIGYTPERMAAFRQNLAAIPELQAQADAILDAMGVNANLSGESLRTARQQVINGMIDGAIYQEQHKPVRDENVMSAAERARLAQSADATALNAALYGYKKNSVGQWVPDPELQNVKGRNNTSGGTGGSGTKKGTQHTTQLKKRLRIKWTGNDPKDPDYDPEDIETTVVPDDEGETAGKLINFDNLPEYAKERVREIIGYDGADADYYQYFFKPYDGGWIDDTEAELEIIPREIKTDDAPVLDGSFYGQK